MKNKKYLIGLLALSLLTACGNKNETANSENSTNTSAETLETEKTEVTGDVYSQEYLDAFFEKYLDDTSLTDSDYETIFKTYPHYGLRVYVETVDEVEYLFLNPDHTFSERRFASEEDLVDITIGYRSGEQYENYAINKGTWKSEEPGSITLYSEGGEAETCTAYYRKSESKGFYYIQFNNTGYCDGMRASVVKDFSKISY